ncbi:hypothetical protein Tco_1313680 [Tanacetum coccineum]
MGFLWCQGELTKGKAKVSWDIVCKPKNQGGLGLKNMGVWNEVLMIKHLWNVATKKDTLWVKWIYTEKLKGRSIWEVDCDNNSTVGWKNILSLRDKVIQDGRWKWPEDWSTEFAELGHIQVPTVNEEIEDNAVWRSGNGLEKDF